MNNYHFYEEEGKGKYSVIFKARKKRRLDFVAIKRMDKSRKKKILNQANILATLAHPNIIKFYEYIQSKNHMWAVTQYCPGGDLLHIIQQDKSLPENIVRRFIIQILQGLQYCHSKGVIMCDLKPASILINEYGNAKLGDFGSAKTLMDLTHSQKETKKGTPSYMAPEIFLSGGVYSFQSDLWSIGCIMYELAQGNPPFISASYQDIAKLANTAKTPKVQQFSSDFNNLLQFVLEKEPEKRISWQKLVEHPWISSELKFRQIPDQPHFQKYLQQKQKGEDSNKPKLLRVSQDFSKNSYGTSQNIPKANDRRGQFIFQNDEEDYSVEFQEDFYNPDAKMQLNEKQLQNAFIKKKNKQEIRGDRKQKQIDREKEMLEDSSNINMFLETVSRKNLTPLSQIIHHNSDNGVKPIIGNQDIQIIESFNFNKKGLGFPYIDPQTLAEGIINGDMEEQLKQIFDGMVGDQKFNVMGYFESIIQNSDVANYLFKQNFIKFYMKLMKGYKQAVLRAKMFEAMGFLVRHATVIQPTIIKYGIINAFVEGASKDKSEKVRRKAMAALGQLLFYGATQVDEGVVQWDLSLSLIHSLLKILKNNQQDQIVRIYCCKSIENITAQAKQVGLKFSQIDTLMVLINVFNSTKNQGFKTSVACCFHHILQLNQSLRQILLQKIGINNLIDTIKSSQVSSKTLQIILWILITQFKKSKTSKISKVYLEDQLLFRAILGKLDSVSSPIAKGRIYLYIYFYLQSDPKKSINLLQNNSNMVTINNNKLFSILEKQNGNNVQKQNKYEVQCIQYVLVWLHENYQNIIKLTHEDIKRIHSKIEGGYSASNTKKRNGYCGILWHMSNCPSFEELFATQANIQALLSILSLLDSLPVMQGETSFEEREDSAISNMEFLKGIYMQILQKVTSNNTISEKLQEYYSSKVLPFIVGRILKSKHQDIKFNCMKYFLYLVSFYMNEEYIFDSTILNVTSSKIIQLINLHLFPEIDNLLGNNENEAIPTMTMKLLAVLFQINDIFIKKFHELGKIQIIINSGHYKESANINVLKLVQKIVAIQAQCPSKEAISEWMLKIMSISSKILNYYLNTNQEIFLEYPIEILKDLIRINGKNWSQDEINSIWEKALPLQGHEDIVIRQKAQSLVKSMLDTGRYGAKGKWDIKQKNGLENYEKYLQISGKQRDPKVTENFNKLGSSRYN